MSVSWRLPAAHIARAIFRRELLPQRVLWWMAADGMKVWNRTLARELEPHLPGRAKAILARANASMFVRRAALLRDRGRLRGEAARDPGILMAALYRIERTPRARWIVDQLGGPARGIGERLHAQQLLSAFSVRERWDEVATHLGELLIVLTEQLPPELPHARKIMGDICFEAGVVYGRRMKESLGFRDPIDDPPSVALEVLRTSEWIFQVNPEHWSHSDKTSGFLEGSACPWYTRPGWNGAHCGIFGQFQSGVSSVFGLRYHLSKTIPKNGGHTCRIDVKPIQLRTRA